MLPGLMAELSLRRTLLIAGRRVDVGALRVHGAGETQRITPKALGVLLELAREPGLTRTREELLLKVWAGRAGDGDVLTQAVKELRRLFGDDPAAPHFIETVPRLGYRLLASVGWDDPAPAVAETTPAELNLDALAPITAAALPAVAANEALPAPRLPRWVLLLSLAAFVLAGFSLLLSWRSSTRSAPPAYTPLMLTADPGPEALPRISPDGARVAYTAPDADSGRMRVQVRGVNASDVLQPSTGQGAESWPVWSPDGALLAFKRDQAGRCDLVTVDALGGAERVRSPCIPGMFDGFDWSPDGKAFAIARFGHDGSARLIRRAVDGSGDLPFDYAHNPGEHDLSPHYSPDGRSIAFRRGLSPYSDLYLVGAEGGAVRRLTDIAARIRGFDWLADSSGLVFASDHEGSEALYRLSLDSGGISALGVAPARMPDIATRADALVFEVPRTRTVMTAYALNETTAGSDVVPSTGSDAYAVLSPEGRRVAFVSDRSGSQQLWLFDADSRQSFALTREGGAVFLYPQWNKDGSRLLVTRRQGGRGQLLEIDLVSQVQQPVSPDSSDVRFGTYAPDEGYLLLENAEDGAKLSRLAAARANAQVLRHQVAAVETDLTYGRIYYSRIGGGVRELRANEAEEQDIAVVPDRFAWHVRAGALWHLDNGEDDQIVLRRRDSSQGGDSTVWRGSGMIDHRHFDLSADAQRLLLIRVERNDTDIGLLRNLRAVH